MRISYSAIETYKNCPLHFKYQELDKIKTPKSIEAVFGTAVHKALRKMFEKSPLFPTTDEVIDFFQEKWHLSLTTISDQNEESSRAYFQEGVSMLKNFYKKNPPWNFNVVELESRFEVIIEDKQTQENHVLAGIIDRIDKSPDNNVYEIIDYKTSKRMPSKDTLDKNLQLSIYNLGILKKWPHLKPEDIKLSLYFLKHGEKIETKRILKDLEKTKEEILKIINEIQDLSQNNKEFIPTPSALCDWCGYKKQCPMWRHLYAKESPDLSENSLKMAIEEYFALKTQNQQNNRKISQIQAQINEAMNIQGIERIFGENGYLTRVLLERTTYDMPQIKELLEKLGKWNEVIKKKQYSILKATKKKIKK